LCTGYSERMDAARAHALGIRALLTKPVDKAQMARTIRQVLDGDTPRHPAAAKVSYER